MFHFPTDFVVVDFEPDPRVLLILRRCFLKTGRALIDVHKGELTLHIENEAITYNLDQTSRYSANYDQMTANKIDVTYEACEEYFQEVLGFFDVTASSSPTPSDDPIVSTTSPTLTPFGDSDFLLFEEANAFLAISSDVVELKDMVRALLLDKKNQSSAPAPTPSPTPAPVKAVESNCVTCGGTHSYQNCPATSGNVYQDNIQEYVSQATSANYNQGNTGFHPQMVANQIRPIGFPHV
nr:reverse transcriptase domain-containing protein [Tanacetum cinerariifolium]